MFANGCKPSEDSTKQGRGTQQSRRQAAEPGLHERQPSLVNEAPAGCHKRLHHHSVQILTAQP